MLSRIRLTEILNEIGTNFSLDEDDICSFTIRDKFTINVEFDEENENTYVYGTIGDLPSDYELQLLVTEEIASANFMCADTLGNVLSMDPESDNVVYQAFYSEEIDLKTFIVDFAEKLEFWCEHYKEIVAKAEQKLAESQTQEPNTQDTLLNIE